MNYEFKRKDKLRITDRFGEEFFNSVSESLDLFLIRWSIKDLKLVESFSSNLVFKGRSQIYGSVVMKFASNKKEFINEVNALKYFDESQMCKLIEFDLDQKVLLEENILPGTELIKEKFIENRLEVYCDLYMQLHSKISNEQLILLTNSSFNSYKGWVTRITDYISQEENWLEIATHMKNAKELYMKLSKDYNKKHLLHGDFHYYNILESENGYKLIDPKGVIGDPIFDIPRYMLNEFWDEKNELEIDKTMEKVFDIISHQLNISRKILSVLLYIEGAMAICWYIEDGASINKKDQYLFILEKFSMYIRKYSKIN
jgi:streptomycin 6-kinase